MFKLLTLQAKALKLSNIWTLASGCKAANESLTFLFTNEIAPRLRALFGVANASLLAPGGKLPVISETDGEGPRCWATLAD
jgi:hypothetical protein